MTYLPRSIVSIPNTDPKHPMIGHVGPFRKRWLNFQDKFSLLLPCPRSSGTGQVIKVLGFAFSRVDSNRVLMSPLQQG